MKTLKDMGNISTLWTHVCTTYEVTPVLKARPAARHARYVKGPKRRLHLKRGVCAKSEYIKNLETISTQETLPDEPIAAEMIGFAARVHASTDRQRVSVRPKVERLQSIEICKSGDPATSKRRLRGVAKNPKALIARAHRGAAAAPAAARAFATVPLRPGRLSAYGTSSPTDGYDVYGA
ncbi:hypothetical protein EVAR_92464_1 [Eumeta japonica]|uniref:Uncharacterized protein n=1 Tax=Eumeta variegata TaxID=151549 RepID=A0A4C1T934_EUMVA|nr:hypothetical protein EVAR_92464_1 [Eumeta japonica]